MWKSGRSLLLPENGPPGLQIVCKGPIYLLHPTGLVLHKTKPGVREKQKAKLENH